MSVLLPRMAIVLGSTGAVGFALTRLLAQSYERVMVVTRQKVEAGYFISDLEESASELMSRRFEFVWVQDFAKLEETLLDRLEPFESPCDVFIAFGTTIKQVGSEAEFMRIDHGYPMAFARTCYALGARQCYLLSALGASPDSKVFYNRVKGLLEQEMAQIGFDRLVCFQPSLLLERHNSQRSGDQRLMEGLASRLFAFMLPLLPKVFQWRPIAAENVAKSIFITAIRDAQRLESLKAPDQVGGNPLIQCYNPEIIDNRSMLAMTLGTLGT